MFARSKRSFDLGRWWLNTHNDPRDVALGLALRSDLKTFNVGAVIFDKYGIFSWGWNHWLARGEQGLISVCAERHALGIGGERLVNRRRLAGATIVVAGCKKHNGNIFLARPCEICFPFIVKFRIRKIIYTQRGGSWGEDRLY
ncbi:MAG: hypothetical protein A3I24_01900 [Candidatus Harrisonbacteria bacterium RIFCSPLOWO2_02_FULL_41_13b]|uniref:CMP/dCMP-type deaminase domain-containing protein n=1 Tax=Candidatus Harrisonbacteria bacterium RIFCSPLOWO2_02_FULL_41_13b TaxID=1798409 RepID=A0A1G1ZSB3_9BACT|nr:MAG: hypothetical protein A3I24_01900 [Candidatus Harrisonbacteria bacterium RIFCSPLOWO2_02_FULL_41_13b]